MNSCALSVAGLLCFTGLSLAQLPLVNFEHPGWSENAVLYPVSGSANSAVSRAQSSSGAQSLEIPANGAALNAIRVTGTVPSGGGYSSMISS